MSLVLLSACGAPVSRPMPLAESGPVAVTVQGQSYIADLQPVQGGATLAVTRDGAAFGNADGLKAKRAAEAFCATRKGRVSPQAYGHFSGGVWLFQGGCA
jgi:hypothetical protein